MKSIRNSIGDRVFDITVNALLFFGVIIILYPLYFIVISSVSSPEYVNAGEVLFYPKGITFSGYGRIIADERIWTGYRNTIIYTVAGTLLNLFVTLMAGYSLSRKDLAGRGFIMGIFVFTMYFGGGMIPTYLLVKGIGLYNSPFVLIILGAVQTYNLIITKTFFQSTIPGELLEAAFIDGCSNAVFFFKIALPLSKAIIAVLALYYGVSHWNEFFNALLYTTEKKIQPLQLVLRDILVSSNQIRNESLPVEDMTEMDKIVESLKYGVIIVSSLPVLMIYPFIQKYFVKGVLIGSLKG